MNHTQLKEKVLSKFKTIKNFCDQANLEEGRTRAFLNRKPVRGISEDEQGRINDMIKLVNKTPNLKKGIGNEITEEDRREALTLIKKLSRNLTAFVEDYPQWDYWFIHNITSGGRKIKNKQVIEFFEFLNKEANGKK